MADIWKWFLLIVGTMMVLNAFWLATEALVPALVERTRQRYEHPIRLTFQGLAIALPLGLVAGLFFHFARNPVMNILGVSVVAVLVLGGLCGSSGLAQRVGLGLPSVCDATQPWRRVLRGGMVLTMTFLLPFIGWFFLLPWALVTGFGAVVLSRRTPATAQPVLPPIEPLVGAKPETATA